MEPILLLLGPPGFVAGLAAAVAFVRRGRHVLLLLLLGLALAVLSSAAVSWSGALEGDGEYAGLLEVLLILTNTAGWALGVAAGALVPALRGR